MASATSLLFTAASVFYMQYLKNENYFMGIGMNAYYVSDCISLL